jgi:Domain of unknown function (DUF4041)/Meiotically up-regulated gene 113/Protein of unknown function (DUF2510)
MHAAGWYPDPWQRAALRYWDGAQWTQHESGPQSPTGHQPQPVQAPPSAAAAPASKTGDVPIFGARGRAKELAEEVEQLRAQVQRLSRLEALSVAELEERRDALTREIAESRARSQDELTAVSAERATVAAELDAMRAKIVVTADEEVLQEVGIYEYRHPLSDAVAYEAELARLKDAIKTMARPNGGAVLAVTDWHVNGSRAQGRKMVSDYSKLVLRAYNAEADNLVRGLKPYKLTSAVDRLTKVATTIEKLGRTMDIRISDQYHALRVLELELTADYLEHKAQEKEREREERERLREERKAQQEMERERERLEKERQHHINVLEAMLKKGDDEGVVRLREQLNDVEKKIEDVDYRAANIRAGYVYVISNLGSFGERMVKIGMTRRLEPMDRVRELGDASVPFRFDVHALFFSEDAVGIETKLHERFADRRVNRVNLRREFFYATPEEVKQELVQLTGEMLEYEEFPEAVEYRQTVRETSRTPTPTAAGPSA